MSRIFKAISFFILLASLLVFSPSAISAPAKQKIGVIIPMTGAFARYGTRIRQGIEKVPAENFKFVYEDEGCNARSAVTAHRKLSSVDSVRLFLGPWCGSPQAAVAPLLKSRRQIAILGASAPRSVFKTSGGRMFSVQHSIEEESVFNANEVYRMGTRKIVLVFFENYFSRAHEKSFGETFKGEVLETFAYTSQDISTLKAIVLRIKRLNPDSLYVPDALPLMHGLVKELKQVGLGDRRIFSVYSAQSEDVLTALGKDGEGLTYSYPKIGEKTALLHFSELATRLLVDVASRCSDSDECILRVLKDNYNFDEYGVLEGELGLKQIKNGKFTWIE